MKYLKTPIQKIAVAMSIQKKRPFQSGLVNIGGTLSSPDGCFLFCIQITL